MLPAPYQSNWMPNQLQAMQNIMRMRQKSVSGGGQAGSRPGFLPGDRPRPMPAPQPGSSDTVFTEQPTQPGVPPKKRKPIPGLNPYSRNPRQDFPQNQGGFDPRLMDFT